jgi:hypothetical protein
MTEMMTTVIGLLIAIIGLVTLVIRGQAKAQRPNGGKSQYDLLLRIDKSLDRLERNQDDHLSATHGRNLMLDKLSPEARHLMLLLIGAVIAWASTELPTQLNPLAASLLGAITTAALAWLTPITRQYGIGAPETPDKVDKVE